MKHVISITSSQTTVRQNQWWLGLGLLLLLVLVALQTRVLPLEPLADQLLSINEANVSEQLLLAKTSDGDNDQPCDVVLAAVSDLPQTAGYTGTVSHRFQTSDSRWTTPSPRAPPVFS